MERWRKISLAFLFGAFIVHCYASNVAFFESFDDSFEDRWTVSDKDEYTGIWEHSKSEGHEDYGLLVSKKARKYGIVKELDQPLNLNEGKAVLQYEVRLQNGLECGGAYLKFLQPQEAGWTPKEFNNSSPYSIMFGPDICGTTNKVHFIVRHKNPVSGDYSEHHLKSPPQVATDRRSHVYTAVIKPGNKLQILIDGEVKKKAGFLNADDFEPPLIPSKTIPDPDEEKPEDWDDRAEIPDETAVKPEDWDEDAPMEIPDEEAKKPAGWMDNEPLEIDDPDATKPEDWDEEEDGEWEAPRVMNPKCEFVPGCGEWTRPMKSNPAYKGKWQVPLIPNPNYKGVWSPQQIPNPHYFEMSKPDFEPISAVGIEIWTMQDGILFDNILITRDEAAAKSYRETLWLPKFKAEKKAEDEANGPYFQRKMFELLFKLGRTPFLGPFRPKIMELIILGEESPKLTMSIVVALIVLAITALFKAYSVYRNRKLEGKVSEKGGTVADEQEGGGEKIEDEKEEGGTTRKRSAAKRED